MGLKIKKLKGGSKCVDNGLLYWLYLYWLDV